MLCSTEGLTLLKPGSMLPESTTTTGDSLPVIHVNPFHIISADVTIKPEKKKERKLQMKKTTFRTTGSKQKPFYIKQNISKTEEYVQNKGA